MRLSRTMIGLGSIAAIALIASAGCTHQESGTPLAGNTRAGTSSSSQPLTESSRTFAPSSSSIDNSDETSPADTGEQTSAIDTGAETSAETATTTASSLPKTTATQSTASGAWSAGPNKAGGPPVPLFPASLPAWRLNDSWDVTSPAVVGDWTPASGADNGLFPSTVNGCQLQRFLVRWRAVEDQARIEAHWANAAGIPGASVTGHAGWFDLDGCTTPQFRFVASDGVSTRSAVAVAVQEYFPAG